MTILTASIAQVNLGAFQLEGLRDELGAFYISRKELIRLGLTPSGYSDRQLKGLLGIDIKNCTVTLLDKKSLETIEAIDLMSFGDMLLHLSINGHRTALAIIGKADAYSKFMLHKQEQRKVAKSPEKKVRDKLHKRLGGEIEVRCLAGSIDLLTSLEIIEVKQVKGWKSALGQLLTYSDYYPSHAKRIHLFGETQESYLAMIEKHCNKYGVLVTWER